MCANCHGDESVLRKKRTKVQQQIEEIPVSAFRDIHIHFSGDVYLLAVWIAMSDHAKCTPTSMPQTTLHGLASKFSLLYGVEYTNPIGFEDVMAVFLRHGIKGNPCLRLDEKGEQSLTISLV